MNHTPTPYRVVNVHFVLADTENKVTVIANCNNHEHAKFIVLACNAHDELVKTLKRVEANLTVDTATRLGIYKALKLAYGE